MTFRARKVFGTFEERAPDIRFYLSSVIKCPCALYSFSKILVTLLPGEFDIIQRSTRIYF